MAVSKDKALQSTHGVTDEHVGSAYSCRLKRASKIEAALPDVERRGAGITEPEASSIPGTGPGRLRNFALDALPRNGPVPQSRSEDHSRRSLARTVEIDPATILQPGKM